MKRTTVYWLTMLAAFMLIWAGLPFAGAQAEESLKYSCSNQIYSSIDKEKIELFTQKTGIKVEVSLSSSSSAVYRLMNGFSDVASTARALERHPVDYGYSKIPFCKDPLAVIAHTDCHVSNLTEDQLQAVFSGMIQNWKEVGGPDMPITVIVPGKDTAANKNFRRQVMKHQEIKYDLMTWDSTMAMMAVKYFPCGAISFIARGAATKEEDIVTLQVNGLMPTDKDYPLYQIFYYITRGEPAGPVKTFIDFTFSDEIKNLMLKNGMLPLAR